MRPCPPPHPAPSKPRHALPAGACDSHCHVFGPVSRFPYAEARDYTPDDQPKEKLFALHAHLGVARRVVVQASVFGTDNAALLDALAARPADTRGVADLPAGVTEAELHRLHAAGVRGVRFNFMIANATPPDPAAVVAMGRRIAPLGWHLVLHFDAGDIPNRAPMIAALEAPVVIDHLARLRAADWPGPPADTLLRLLEQPHVHAKLSGVERGSATGAPFADMLALWRAVAAAAPGRAIWGTDWPHPVLDGPMPDDGALVDFLFAALPDPAVRQAVLVDTPARLYGF